MFQKIKQAPASKIRVAIILFETGMLLLAMLIINLPLVFSATTATGNGVWNWQNPRPQGNRLNTLQCFDPYQCYAAGDNGTILKRFFSTTWELQSTPTANNLMGLSCLNNYICVAVGTRGEIEVTTDPAGQNWHHITTSYSTDLNAVNCVGHGPAFTCYAVGDNGQVLRTINSGDNWTAVAFPSTDPLKTVFCYTSTGADNNCLVGGGKVNYSAGGPTSVLYQTLDNGVSWTDVLPLSATSLQPFNSVHCPNGSYTTCLAVGDNGQAFSTTSFGTSGWIDVGGFTTLPLNSVSCAYTTHCVAVGIYGAAWNYDPASDPAWTSQDSSLPNSLNLFSVACIADPANQCYAAGDVGRIISNNGGTPPWTTETEGLFGTQLTAVSCPTPGKCYAAGHLQTSGTGTFTGRILYTGDEGQNWNLQSSAAPPHPLKGIDCLNTSPVKCVAVGVAGTVLTTIDGGANWVDQTATSSTTKNLAGVKCLVMVPITCYAVGGLFAADPESVIIKSTDGGVTWVTQSPPALMNNEELTSISCTGPLRCFAAGGSNYNGHRRVIGTTDGGTSWTSLYSQAVPNSLFNAITCPDALTCYAAGGYQGIYSGMQVIKTTNGGVTWTNQAEVTGTPGNQLPAPYSISCLTATTCFTAGVKGTIMATRDGEATWAVQLSGTTNDLYGLNCLVGCVTVGQGAAILNNSVFVSNLVDDGSGGPGTLTFALATAKPGQAVALDLPGGSLTITNGDAKRVVPEGVAFGSPCSMPVAYNFNYLPGSLILNGNDTVLGLSLYKWVEPALLIHAGAGGNSLNCFRVLAS